MERAQDTEGKRSLTDIFKLPCFIVYYKLGRVPSIDLHEFKKCFTL